MTKSNGIKSLKQAAKLLNRHAPDGESLAYINKDEAKLLRSHGGSGIQTLQGVPTYGAIWDIAKKFIPDAWEPALETVGNLGKGVYDFLGYGKQDTGETDKETGKKIYTPGRSLVNDAMSVWVALRAKKEQEGLNAAEMEQFNKLNQQLSAAETEFDVSTDLGTQLTAPEYTTDVADVAAYKPIDFSGSATPDLTTTAVAEGGRIGYNKGSTWQEFLADKTVRPNPDDKDWRQVYYRWLEQQRTKEAQGGRIGYNFGGIGALNPRMGYALGEEVEQITEEVTPFSKIPPNIKMADIDDLPDWWLTDFEQLLEEFRGDNSGRNPQNLNDLEKWHRFKYGKAQGPNIEEVLNLAAAPEIENRNEQSAEMFKLMEGAAQGGRIGAQSGGIMPLLNMGGMEKDYRQDGGFVPIGRREKADDVPARLSKNEFVFTADAVKAAGGGDIDQGAQRMYNVMKNLEAGGDISEQSQGQA